LALDLADDTYDVFVSYSRADGRPRRGDRFGPAWQGPENLLLTAAIWRQVSSS